MKEYIEKAAIHELVKRIPKYEMFNYDRTTDLLGINPDDVDFGVDKIPAADVVEVRHGRWIWNAHHCKWECSECGGMEGECESPVCKWCGTRMDKEDEP